MIDRDPTFRPRTLDEWQEYVAERAAIGEYERGMTRADAERFALILAGPKPGDREQMDLLGGKTQPQPAARSKRR